MAPHAGRRFRRQSARCRSSSGSAWDPGWRPARVPCGARQGWQEVAAGRCTARHPAHCGRGMRQGRGSGGGRPSSRDTTTRYYVRARHLDIFRCRWLTGDRIGFRGGDWNLYRYALCGPTSYMDRDGLTARMPGCAAEQDRLIRRHLNDICRNRIRFLPKATLRACLLHRCHNVQIGCFPNGTPP